MMHAGKLLAVILQRMELCETQVYLNQKSIYAEINLCLHAFVYIEREWMLAELAELILCVLNFLDTVDRSSKYGLWASLCIR